MQSSNKNGAVSIEKGTGNKLLQECSEKLTYFGHIVRHDGMEKQVIFWDSKQRRDVHGTEQ